MLKSEVLPFAAERKVTLSGCGCSPSFSLNLKAEPYIVKHTPGSQRKKQALFPVKEKRFFYRKYKIQVGSSLWKLRLFIFMDNGVRSQWKQINGEVMGMQANKEELPFGSH